MATLSLLLLLLLSCFLACSADPGMISPFSLTPESLKQKGQLKVRKQLQYTCMAAQHCSACSRAMDPISSPVLLPHAAEPVGSVSRSAQLAGVSRAQVRGSAKEGMHVCCGARGQGWTGKRDGWGKDEGCWCRTDMCSRLMHVDTPHASHPCIPPMHPTHVRG